MATRLWFVKLKTTQKSPPLTTVRPESLRLLSQRDDLSPFAPNAFALLALESRFALADIVSLAPSILTENRDDKKCDLLFVGRDHRTAVICQAYMAASDKETPKVNKASDLNTAASWILNPSDESKLGVELLAAREDLLDAISNDEIDAPQFMGLFSIGISKNAQQQLSNPSTGIANRRARGGE